MTLVLGQSSYVTDNSGLTTIDMPSFDINEDTTVFLFIILNGSIQVSSISDTAGLTWEPRVLVDPSGQLDIEEWVAFTSSLPVSANVITVNFSGAASLVTALAFGVPGGDVLNPFDITPPITGVSMPLSVSTSAVNTMVIGAYRQSITPAPTAGAGFIQLPVVIDFSSEFDPEFQIGSYLGIEYAIFDSIQTDLLVDETDGSSDIAAGIVDVIRAAADFVPIDTATSKIPLTGTVQFVLADFELENNTTIVEFSVDEDGVVLDEGSSYVYETDFGDPTLRYRVMAIRPRISGDLVIFTLKDAETIF